MKKETLTREKPAARPAAVEDSSAVIRRQLIILGLLFALGLVGYAVYRWGTDIGWGNPDRAVKNKMDFAQQALVERRLPDTIRLYSQVIERYPNHPTATQAQMGLASAYEDSSQPGKAVEIYQQLLAKLAKDPAKSDLRAFTLLQIAKLHAVQGDHEQALKEFAQVRAGYPGSDWAGEALEGTGKSYQARKEYDRAIESYRLLIKEFSKGFLAAAAQSAIGECYEAQEKFSLAFKAYQAVLDGYPSAVWDDARAKMESLQKKMDDLKATKKDKQGHGSGKAG